MGEEIDTMESQVKIRPNHVLLSYLLGWGAGGRGTGYEIISYDKMLSIIANFCTRQGFPK